MLLPKLNGQKWNSSEHNPEEFRLSLIEHLNELRVRIIRSVLIFTTCWVVSWYVEAAVRTFFTHRARVAIEAALPKGMIYRESIFDTMQAFMIPFKFSAMLALIVALPLLILQLWAFIAPGLKPNEQKPFRNLAPISLLLFVVGASFAWYILPSAYSWFANFMDRFPDNELNQEAGSMAFFSLKMMLAFGIGFQLPMVVYILGALNLLSAATLMKYWRHSTVAIFFLSAGLTPSNDPGTMLMMAIPLSLLFMISAYAVKFVQRKKGSAEFLWAGESEESSDSPADIVAPIDTTDHDYSATVEANPVHEYEPAIPIEEQHDRTP